MSDCLRMSGDWHRLDPNLSTRFILNENQLSAEWAPRLPTKKKFLEVIEQYRVKRNEFLSEVGPHRGGMVLCLEVQP